MEITSDSFMAREELLIEELLPNTIFMCLFLVVGIIGNLIVICIYHIRMYGKCGEETRLCILFLAYSDLIASTLASSFGIGMNFHPLSFYNNFACKSVWFITTVCVFASGLILVLISILLQIFSSLPTSDETLWYGTDKIYVVHCVNF